MHATSEYFISPFSMFYQTISTTSHAIMHSFASNIQQLFGGNIARLLITPLMHYVIKWKMIMCQKGKALQQNKTNCRTFSECLPRMEDNFYVQHIRRTILNLIMQSSS
ncbi:hypothetical protein KFK09_023901 [Dendrobium nobile]|uniref:Uncharacterized protein n=1 Tax=Dendrobium nobile TaxID=94219 RepID=A0A8T3AB42_DENNO|nr:hypothetical protein KFK09_023901 [Dendrobium nobile]